MLSELIQKLSHLYWYLSYEEFLKRINGQDDEYHIELFQKFHSIYRAISAFDPETLNKIIGDTNETEN